MSVYWETVARSAGVTKAASPRSCAHRRADNGGSSRTSGGEGSHFCVLESEVKAEIKVHKEKIQAGSLTLQAAEGCLQTAWKGKMTVT